MTRIRKFIIAVTFLSVLAGESQSCAADLQRIAINGIGDVLVTKKDILLSDIATVGPRFADQDGQNFEAEAQEFRNMVIAASPEPGKSLLFKGQAIVDRLRVLGVKLETVAYSFPQEVTIQRAGRKPSNEELYAATENFLQLQNPELELTAVSSDARIRMFTDSVQYQGLRSRMIRAGILEVTLQAVSNNGEAMEVPVQASVNEWKEVAIASRPIKRGSVIEGSDVSHARVNISNLPNDTLADLASLVGMVTSRDIPAGDNFRSNALIVPSVITSGSKVIISVNSGGLEAHADGIAMENGNRGQMIRVKNIASNKVVQATVKAEGEVEVLL